MNKEEEEEKQKWRDEILDACLKDIDTVKFYVRLIFMLGLVILFTK